MLSIPIISEFDGKGIDKAITEFKQLKTVGEKAQFAIKKAAVPAAAAITGLAVVLGDATKAAIEDQQEQEALELILKNVTGATDDQVAAIEDQISKMSRASGIADTDYRLALEILTIASGDATRAMDDMNLVMDTATALHTDSATIAEALGKAYEGNFKALGKLSPEIKTMIEDGADLDEIMGYMADTFGGAVAANAETAAGKMAILKNSIGETKESIGAALLPVIEAGLPYLQKFADWAGDNPDKFVIIAGAIGAVAASIVAVNIAMSLNPFVIAATGIVAMAVGFNKLADAMDRINKVGGFAARLLGGLISPVVGLTANIIKGLPGLTDLFGSDDKPNPGGGITIPKMASGGIVNSPTLAMIGEKGPEAVIPLSRMGQMGNGINITVNTGVGDPVAIGKSIVDALTAYKSRTGSLASVLA
jgi:hypothetical protein